MLKNARAGAATACILQLGYCADVRAVLAGVYEGHLVKQKLALLVVMQKYFYYVPGEL